MQFIILFMFICFSNSYISYRPLLFYRRQNIPKSKEIQNVADRSTEESDTSDTSDLAVEVTDIGSTNDTNALKKNEKAGKNIRRQAPNVIMKSRKKAVMRSPKKALRVLSSDATDSSDRDKSTFHLEDAYKKDWAQLQLEVLNMTVPQEDDVFMVAARPWGTPCGDPNQHDMPWGSCMLPQECDPDYRLYRGDYFCGRTEFICCALLDNAYDLNLPFDASFGDSEFNEDSDELKYRIKYGDKAKKKDLEKRKGEDSKRRREERQKRKDAIKDIRDDIFKELRKLLNKATSNSTKIKHRKKKQMKLFLEELRNQYKKDRQAMKDIQEVNVIRIDLALKTKFDQLMKVQKDFMTNETFKNIVLNAQKTMTIARSDAMLLMEAFPELQPYFIKRRHIESENEVLPYDVEYGLMYY